MTSASEPGCSLDVASRSIERSSRGRKTHSLLVDAVEPTWAAPATLSRTASIEFCHSGRIGSSGSRQYSPVGLGVATASAFLRCAGDFVPHAAGLGFGLGLPATAALRGAHLTREKCLAQIGGTHAGLRQIQLNVIGRGQIAGQPGNHRARRRLWPTAPRTRWSTPTTPRDGAEAAECAALVLYSDAGHGLLFQYPRLSAARWSSSCAEPGRSGGTRRTRG